MKKTTLLLLFIFLAQAIYAQQPYYDDVDLTKTGLALRDELAQKIIETHTNLLEYSPGVWEASRITDVDPNDNSKVLLLYGYENGTDSDVTNDLNRDKYQNGGQVGDWNREHTYPKSLGNPNLGESGPGSDAHHLRPTDVQRNGARGNRKFAAGSGNSGTVGENWYPGDEEGIGGIYNFVTKRGICKGARSKISWTQVETGSAITWKYPSVILRGEESVGEFYSVALANLAQQADTGTKMIHLGKNTRSTVISKGISAGKGQNSYRGLVQVGKNAAGARNFTQCDSLLIGSRCGAHTFPYIEVKNSTAKVEHEATTSKIGEDQIFYCNARGIETQDAVNMIVNGFCKEVFRELPMEFAMEAQALMDVSLEGSVG